MERAKAENSNAIEKVRAEHQLQLEMLESQFAEAKVKQESEKSAASHSRVELDELQDKHVSLKQSLSLEVRDDRDRENAGQITDAGESENFEARLKSERRGTKIALSEVVALKRRYQKMTENFEAAQLMYAKEAQRLKVKDAMIEQSAVALNELQAEHAARAEEHQTQLRELEQQVAEAKRNYEAEEVANANAQAEIENLQSQLASTEQSMAEASRSHQAEREASTAVHEELEKIRMQLTQSDMHVNKANESAREVANELASKELEVQQHQVFDAKHQLSISEDDRSDDAEGIGKAAEQKLAASIEEDNEDSVAGSQTPEGAALYYGYMEKIGAGGIMGRKNWKKRYFVLYSNVIKYYASYNAAKDKPGKPLGEIVLDPGKKIKIEDRPVKSRGQVPHMLIETTRGRIHVLRPPEGSKPPFSDFNIWQVKIEGAWEKRKGT